MTSVTNIAGLEEWRTRSAGACQRALMIRIALWGIKPLFENHVLIRQSKNVFDEVNSAYVDLNFTEHPRPVGRAKGASRKLEVIGEASRLVKRVDYYEGATARRNSRASSDDGSFAEGVLERSAEFSAAKLKEAKLKARLAVARAMGVFAEQSSGDDLGLVQAAGLLSRILSTKDRLEFWQRVSQDCAFLHDQRGISVLFQYPIWQKGMPEPTRRNANIETLTWLRWYRDFIAGNPIRLDALLELSQISHSPLLARTEKFATFHLIDLAALPESVVFDQLSGKFTLEPHKINADKLYQNALRKVKDDIFRIKAKKDSNAYYSVADVIELVEHTLENYSDEPMAVHDDFAKALKMIIRKIESDDLPRGDNLIENFVEDLNTGAVDIRAIDEGVAKAVNARMRLKLRKPTLDETKSLLEVVRIGATKSDDRLAHELVSDAETIVKFKSRQNAQVDVTAEQAVQRVSSRLPQIANSSGKNAIDKVVDASEKVESISKGVEAAGNTVSQTARWVYYLYSMFS